jgi:hypothetical protein
MDNHICTRGIIKIHLNGVPRSAPGTEKLKGKARESKGMNSDSVKEEVS